MYFRRVAGTDPRAYHRDTNPVRSRLNGLPAAATGPKRVYWVDVCEAAPGRIATEHVIGICRMDCVSGLMATVASPMADASAGPARFTCGIRVAYPEPGHVEPLDMAVHTVDGQDGYMYTWRRPSHRVFLRGNCRTEFVCTTAVPSAVTLVLYGCLDGDRDLHLHATSTCHLDLDPDICAAMADPSGALVALDLSTPRAGVVCAVQWRPEAVPCDKHHVLYVEALGLAVDPLTTTAVQLGAFGAWDPVGRTCTLGLGTPCSVDPVVVQIVPLPPTDGPFLHLDPTPSVFVLRGGVYAWAAQAPTIFRCEEGVSVDSLLQHSHPSATVVVLEDRYLAPQCPDMCGSMGMRQLAKAIARNFPAMIHLEVVCRWRPHPVNVELLLDELLRLQTLVLSVTDHAFRPGRTFESIEGVRVDAGARVLVLIYRTRDLEEDGPDVMVPIRCTSEFDAQGRAKDHWGPDLDARLRIGGSGAQPARNVTPATLKFCAEVHWDPEWCELPMWEAEDDHGAEAWTCVFEHLVPGPLCCFWADLSQDSGAVPPAPATRHMVLVVAAADAVSNHWYAACVAPLLQELVKALDTLIVVFQGRKRTDVSSAFEPALDVPATMSGVVGWCLHLECPYLNQTTYPYPCADPWHLRRFLHPDEEHVPE